MGCQGTEGLNWTKVGLKVFIDNNDFARFKACLNWTKVGLKAWCDEGGIIRTRKFELD
mgnify:CR=1 FL=1